MAPIRSSGSLTLSTGTRSSSPPVTPYPGGEDRRRRSSSQSNGDEDEPQPKRKPADPRIHLGKHLARTQNVKFRSALVFNHGIKILAEINDLGDDGDEEEAVEPPRNDPQWDLFKTILEGLPGAKRKLTDEKWVADTARLLDKGAANARSDDVASLKKAVVDFLPICDPPVSRTSKTRRGFNHPYLGSLLCPTSLNWLDDMTQRELRDEVVAVKHSDYPPFLYRDYIIDEDDLLEGLFESTVLLKAARHIFVSPSSVDEEAGSRSTRAGNAALNGMTRITPATIAYVATQVRFALSSDTIFGRKLKLRQFDLYAFYDNILNLLTRPEMAARTGLILDLWTENVLGTYSDDVDDGAGGTATAILAQLRNTFS
ncbi:hypothetical protein FRC04_001105 [Tulasnella sp. 424]|nr:hypothetical protein FRC04_001105 [Tulasnella sp. 424]KAG8969645.1 hypothetical protein FRC05_001010 [Tulasnella sp. 425]